MGNLAQVSIVRVACGGHALRAERAGELFTFGNGKHGQLGHGEPRPDALPRRVSRLRHLRVLGIACGDFHSLALADDGYVYTWGAGAFGELGHGDLRHCAEPRRLDGVRRHALAFAACGACWRPLLAPSRGDAEPHPADAGGRGGGGGGGFYGDDDNDSDSGSNSATSSAGESATTASTRGREYFADGGYMSVYY